MQWFSLSLYPLRSPSVMYSLYKPKVSRAECSGSVCLSIPCGLHLSCIHYTSPKCREQNAVVQSVSLSLAVSICHVFIIQAQSVASRMQWFSLSLYPLRVPSVMYSLYKPKVSRAECSGSVCLSIPCGFHLSCIHYTSLKCHEQNAVVQSAYPPLTEFHLSCIHFTSPKCHEQNAVVQSVSLSLAGSICHVFIIQA